MRWQEVRKLYPNKSVVFKILEFHVIGNIGWVDELGLGAGNIFKYNKII